jgi:hypothetical protein
MSIIFIDQEKLIDVLIDLTKKYNITWKRYLSDDELSKLEIEYTDEGFNKYRKLHKDDYNWMNDCNWKDIEKAKSESINRDYRNMLNYNNDLIHNYFYCDNINIFELNNLKLYFKYIEESNENIEGYYFSIMDENKNIFFDFKIKKNEDKNLIDKLYYKCQELYKLIHKDYDYTSINDVNNFFNFIKDYKL